MPARGRGWGELVAVLAVLGGAASLGGCDDAEVAGAQLFLNNCAVCHGQTGEGAPSGPPLVHELYVPERTPDDAFQVAVQEGVDEQHWGFGDMPPLPGLSREDVAAITGHVRDLQRAAGLLPE